MTIHAASPSSRVAHLLGSRLARNIGALTLANLATRLASFVVLGVLGRTLGKEGLGSYATAVALGTYFMLMADCGLSHRLAREGAAQPTMLAGDYRESIHLKNWLALTAVAALGLTVVFLPYSQMVVLMCAAMGLGGVIQSYSLLNYGVFRAVQRMGAEAAATTVRSSVFLVTACPLLFVGASLLWVGVAAVVASAVEYVVSTIVVRRHVGARVAGLPQRPVFLSALPYAASFIGVMAFSQLDIILISLVANQRILGEYTAISRIYLLALVPGMLVARAIQPGATRAFSSFRRRFLGIVTAYVALSLLCGVLTTIAIRLAASWALGLAFGPRFVELADLLATGSVVVMLKYLNAALATTLTAAGLQLVRAKAVGWGVLATVALVLLFVPPFGTLGALLALMGSEVALALLLWMGVRSHVGVRSARSGA